MTQTPAADIVERASNEIRVFERCSRNTCSDLIAEIEALRARIDDRLAVEERLVELGHKYCDEIKVLRAREAELRQEVDAMREKAVSNARERNALQRKLDEGMGCLHDATCIIGHLVPMDAYALAGKKLVAKDVWHRARNFLASIRGETD